MRSRIIAHVSADLEKLYLETITGQRRGVGPATLRVALAAAELPYTGIMRLRNAMFDRGVKRSVDLRRWTISVGNLTAGGTGKTPVVRWLAQRLLADQIIPAVLTRGYAGSAAGHSDEADLLARAIEPGGVVMVNADRAAGADRALAEHPQVQLFILDDGFQHRRARRDFDLVLINAADPFGHGHVHPRGLLREPITGLSRATAVLITHASRGGASLEATLATIRAANAAVPTYQCDHVLAGLRTATCPINAPPDVPLNTLTDQPFFATAGIGHPQSLQSQLEGFDGPFVGHTWWPDHHAYTDGDVSGLIATATQLGATAIVTTEKDWSKLVFLSTVRESPVPFYRVDVGLAFVGDDEQRLYEAIVERYRSA
ncbi:MAG TPA: tetraacyldisaccharide 4'-kinase [Tepidisphaeraceae bacterium]|jgi:tetraacyldisaccharide 4'-kinase|nr:tetraacyldisaccharide 4'-kinase [Tepidisphaeraceae bacterium]